MPISGRYYLQKDVDSFNWKVYTEEGNIVVEIERKE